MSTDSQQPDENQEAMNPASPNGADAAMTPVPQPANRDDLSKEKRLRLEQLAERANLAHELAKDAALRFCRHSVEAGMALLEANDLCPKGTWLAWLADHFGGSARTAQRYMHEAKLVTLMGGNTTDLSFFHPEELVRHIGKAISRIERQCTTAVAESEMPTTVGAVQESTRPAEVANDNPPSLSSSDDPLTAIIALFDDLLAALRVAIESGQWLDCGQFVLDELERIRGDVDVCRLLVHDAHLATVASV